MKKLLIASSVAVLAFASVAAAQSFTANLTVGSTGAEVSALQTLLISKGYSIPSIASGAATPGYFGSQTKTAVMAYQAANGIPNTGFVGPLTRAALNMGGTPATGCPAGQICTPVTPVSTSCPAGFICTPVGGGTPVTGGAGLVGNDGLISDVQELSQYNNEEVGDGENDVKVLGAEIEASNDGDIALRSVKLTFNGTSNTGSDNLDDYIETVTVWLGSTEVGSADADSFNEDSNGIYSKTITLKSGTIIRSDDTENLYISVDAVNNLDSGDIAGSADAWTVELVNVRFEDGSGVVTTETDAGDLTAGVSTSISFVSFSTSADTELKVSLDSSSPDEDIVVVDDTDDTDNVVLLVGKLRLDGTSDAVIDQLPITLTTSLGDSVQALANSLTLKLGSEEYTESVSISATAGTVTFDNLDFALNAGQTVTFTVLADINDINNSGVTATDFDEGDDLTASLTSTNRDYIDVENEEGDQLSDASEKSGTAIGEGQEFRTEGIGVGLNGTPTATSNNNDGADTGTFTIKYAIKAIGETVYIASLAANSVTYTVYAPDGTATTSSLISAILQNTTDNTKTSVGNWRIDEDQVENFTLTITVPNGTGGTTGQYYVALTGVKWDLSDDTSPATTYSSGLDEFETPPVSLDRS